MDRSKIFDDVKNFAKSGRFKKEFEDAKDEFDLDIGDILKSSAPKDIYDIMLDEWYTFERPEEKSGETFPELYAQEFSSKLSDKDKERVLRLSENKFGFFKVLEKKNDGVKVKDISTGEEYFVEEHEALKNINVGDVLLSRIFPWDDKWLFSGAILSIPEEAIAAIEETQNVGLEKKLAIRAAEELRKEIEQKNPKTQEELSKIIADFEERWNRTPQPELLGLSPDNLEGALLKIDGLSPKEAAKEALKNNNILRALYVIINTGTDRNVGLAATTLRGVAELDPTAVDLDLLINSIREGLNSEKEKWISAVSSELGRAVATVIREDNKDYLVGLLHSKNIALKMVGLDALIYLAKTKPKIIDSSLALEFINSKDETIRGKVAMFFSTLAETNPEQVSKEVLIRLASDKSETIRDICAKAIFNLSKSNAEIANNIIDDLASGNELERSVGEKARDLIEAWEAEKLREKFR
ncbi:MAG: hypothetical protein QXT63_06975 [Thermoplasmata archaeon]